MTVCLIATFKNESQILKEWLEHYISQGVDRFFLVDNDSNDNYYDIIKPYVDSGIVVLVIDRRPNSQIKSYNEHFLDKCKQYDASCYASIHSLENVWFKRIQHNL